MSGNILALLLATHLVAMVTTLTVEELSIIRNYTAAYNRGRHCQQGLSVSVAENHTGFLRLSSTGVPNHPAYRMVTESLLTQEYINHVPDTPYIMPHPVCLPQGIIGFAINGVPFYSSLTPHLYNAVQGLHAEKFDGCHGKVDSHGRYHYKELPALECLFPDWSGNPGDLLHDQFSVLIGVALDGFPIYHLNTTYFNWAWFHQLLDPCHGTNVFGSYRYYVTDRFPYTLGCFHGEVYGNLDRTNRETSLNQICDGMKTQYDRVCICGSENVTRLLSSRNISQTPNRSRVGLNLTTQTRLQKPFVIPRHLVTETDCHFPYNCLGPKLTDYCLQSPAFNIPRDCSTPDRFGASTCMLRDSGTGKNPPVRGDVRRKNIGDKGTSNSLFDCNQRQGSARIIRLGCPPGVKPPGPGGPKPPPPAPNRPGSEQRTSAKAPRQNQAKSRSSQLGKAPSGPVSRARPPAEEHAPMHLDGKAFHPGRPTGPPPHSRDSGQLPATSANDTAEFVPRGPSVYPPGGVRPPNSGVIAPPTSYIAPKPPSSGKMTSTNQPMDVSSGRESTTTIIAETVTPHPMYSKKEEEDSEQKKFVPVTSEGHGTTTVTTQQSKETNNDFGNISTTPTMLRTAPPLPPLPPIPAVQPPVSRPRSPSNGMVNPPSGYIEPKPPSNIGQERPGPPSSKNESPVTAAPSSTHKPMSSTERVTQANTVSNSSIDVQSVKTTLQPPTRDSQILPSNNGFPGPPIGYVEPKAPGTFNSTQDGSNRDGNQTSTEKTLISRPPIVRLLPHGQRPRPPSPLSPLRPPPAYDSRGRSPASAASHPAGPSDLPGFPSRVAPNEPANSQTDSMHVGMPSSISNTNPNEPSKRRKRHAPKARSRALN